MALTRLTGSRLRERRIALGLRQTDVAARAGISASLLNLIEHNRRGVTALALSRLAGVLDTSADHLLAGEDADFLMDLRAAAMGGSAELDRLDDFVMRFPGWAQTVVQAEARAAKAERAMATLSDRLAHDPYLSHALHDLLQALSAVRSTAGILADTPDIAAEWRRRFHANLVADAERMATGAEALVAYLDGSEGDPQDMVGSPDEEFDAWLEAQGWHLAPLEDGNAKDMQALVASLASAAARDLAQRWVDRVTQDVAALPYDRLTRALADHGPDPLRIAASCGVAPMVAMRRLGTMQGTELGLVLCDGSGRLVFRKPGRGFAVPRIGAACALWPIFQALRHPMVPIERRVTTEGRRGPGAYLLRAYAQTLPAVVWGGVELSEAAMLILPEAGRVVSDVMDIVGVSCRICALADCRARTAPSILTG